MLFDIQFVKKEEILLLKFVAAGKKKDHNSSLLVPGFYAIFTTFRKAIIIQLI